MYLFYLELKKHQCTRQIRINFLNPRKWECLSSKEYRMLLFLIIYLFFCRLWWFKCVTKKTKTKQKNTKIQKWWGKHVLGFLKICYIVRFSNVLSLSVIKRFDKKMSYSSNCMVIEMNRVNKRYQWTEKLIDKWLKITNILFKDYWWKKSLIFFHITTLQWVATT